MASLFQNIPTWRIFSISAFLLQSLRIPLALFFAEDASDLNLYFIIVATSIPVQFYAAEVLLYKGINLKIGGIQSLDLIVILVWLATLGYVYVVMSVLETLIYFCFSISLAAFYLAQYVVRENLGATQFLFCEMTLNLMLTIGVVLIVTQWPNTKMSEVILSYTSLVYLMFTIVVMSRFGMNSLQLIERIVQRSYFRPYLFQILLMISTQLERLLIGMIWPTFLGYIAIIGAGTQAWRRLILDDSVLFGQITNPKLDITTVLQEAFHLYWRSSILTISFGLIFYIFMKNGCFHFYENPSVSLIMLSTLTSLGVLYLNFLPSGIVGINVIRAGLIVPSGTTFLYLCSLIGILSTVLVMTLINMLSFDFRFVWILITATAVVNLVMFRDVIRRYDFEIKIYRHAAIFLVNLIFIGVLLYDQL